MIELGQCYYYNELNYLDPPHMKWYVITIPMRYPDSRDMWPCQVWDSRFNPYWESRRVSSAWFRHDTKISKLTALILCGSLPLSGDTI